MLKTILNILETNNVFLTGGGGVGKSFTTRQIIAHYRNQKKNVIVLGSTGIAAVGIGGVTLHSFFCIGISKNHEELATMDRGKWQKEKLNRLQKILERVDLIVIDEISMISPQVFDLVHFRLYGECYPKPKTKLKSTSKFAGRVLIVGDFYQLPPVAKEKNLFIDSNYAFSALSWREFNFKIIELIGSKRSQNKEFNDILSRLRVGQIDDDMVAYLSQFLGVAPRPGDSVISGTNAEASEINSQKLAQIKAPLKISQGEVIIHDNTQKPEKINAWLKNFDSIATLELKVGAKVLFTINRPYEITPYFNGEAGEIINILEQNSIIIRIDVRKENGDVVELDRVNYDLSEYALQNDEVVAKPLASFCQFPLRLSYGLTIHKSQGMSISHLTCNLNRIFADGQLYVALSRAMHPEFLTIIYQIPRNFGQYLRRVLKTNPDVARFYDTASITRFE